MAEKRAAATALRSVRFAKMDDGFSVTLAGNGPLLAANVAEAKDLPPRVLLDFHGVAAGSAPAITNIKNDDVDKIRVATNSREPLITRVVIDLARKLPYTVEQIGEDLRVMFRRAVDTAPRPPSRLPRRSKSPSPRAPVAETPASPDALAGHRRAGGSRPRLPTPPMMAAAGCRRCRGTISQAPLPVPMPSVIAAAMQQPTLPPMQPERRTAQRQFTGDPVTLDFQGADLRAVLRTFAEISNGLNIIIDPSIKGTVDVSLRDVPWDQALDIILRANKLGYSVEGNIVRIVPLNVLAQENEERRKLSEAQALAGELRTLTVPVSYAKAADLVAVITRSTLSSRGDVQVDTRTNTLIIRDLAERIQAAADLIRTLDRPQPQVEIEARIVQLNRNSARELGISWGFNGAIDPQFGTSTGPGVPEQRRRDGRHRRRQPREPVGDRPRARLDQRRAQPRRQPARARKRRQGPHPGDAARRDAEQRRSRNHAGLADSDSDGVEQHRHGDLQGRRADAPRHAADHRLGHGDHAHLCREGVAELHADLGGAAGAVDRHAARGDDGADGGRRDDGHRRHLHARGERPPTIGRRCCIACRCSAGCSRPNARLDDSDELLIFITPRIAK